jgi:hypothetical protein
VTVHHLYWPRRDYQTELERRFRTLPWNKVAMPAAAHELLHRCAAPPRKPPVEEMLAAVELWEQLERQRRSMSRQPSAPSDQQADRGAVA